jgi:hypothetical protein
MHLLGLHLRLLVLLRLLKLPTTDRKLLRRL